MLDWAIRYEPIIRFVSKHSIENILEVGSGSYGLGYYLKNTRITGVDLSFDADAVSNVNKVIAAADKLPFEDNLFEAVVSSDMIEHLDENERRASVDEMIRVSSRYLVIGFPSGVTGKMTDDRIKQRLTRRNLPIPAWLQEHFKHEYPTCEKVMHYLPKNLRVIEVLNNDNVFIHKLVVYMIMSPTFLKLTQYIDSIQLISKLSFITNSFKTYRKVIVLEKPAA